MFVGILLFLVFRRMSLDTEEEEEYMYFNFFY